MRRRFLQCGGLGAIVALLAAALSDVGYAQTKLEDQLGHTLVDWRRIGDYTFVTVQRVPTRCEVVIRVRKKGRRARNPWLELWQAKKVVVTGGPALMQPTPPRGNRLEEGPTAAPRVTYAASRRTVGRRSLRGPSADDTGEARLDRWRDLFEGQTWAVQLPENLFIGFILRTDRRDRAVQVQARQGYHTLRFQSGWEVDVWVVEEDEWIDR